MTEHAAFPPAAADSPPVPDPVAPASRVPGLRQFAGWLTEGLRTSFFLAPRWQGLEAGAGMLAALMLASLGAAVAVERYFIPGPAEFHWRAILGGWYGTVIVAWLCFLFRPHPQRLRSDSAPGAAHLFGLSLTQNVILMLGFGAVSGTMTRMGIDPAAKWGIYAAWGLWLLPIAWSFSALWTVFWRAGDRRHPAVMILALLILLISIGVSSWSPPAKFWYAADRPASRSSEPSFTLTQEAMEAQPALLEKRLAALAPQRRKTVDLYALTFAPYADEEVFRRESEMVATVMASRFDASGRTVQLVNNAGTVQQWPWATPLNLKRAIQRVGRIMDRDEDVLFLHLTSHGAADGELSASFWPMAVGTVRPADLKAWLDEAGIRNRVISISACYSGSWVAPLATDHTLVVTAADAEHTSYGCGRKSDLTFYGRAMFDEQLRTKTRSFEEAFKAAYPVIKEREEKAGKRDGFSNPQIRAGAAIKPRLAELQARLEKGGAGSR
jgi:hypothetical protein